MKTDFIIFDDIIDLLIFENIVLQKKINNQKLTQREQIFDNFVVSPSLILRELLELLKREESVKI
jgi:hypothetical protein